jgi:hypothetical protein
VRLALKNTWEREARVIFTGFLQCQNEANPTSPPHTLGPRRPGTTDENIKIKITTSGGGQNPAHGSWGDHQQSGVILNLHCGSRECIEYLAIHEVGHALGLYHGEERGDWPNNIPGCPPQTHSPSWPWWPIPTEKRWGDPDINSVMAYCSGGPNELSPTDVAGIQRAYGRHLPGTLLSLPASLCLSAHANGDNGERAFGWECDEAYDDQEWKYDVSKSALYIQWPSDPTDARRCLDVDTNDYTSVQIWDCLYGSNQQWQFQHTMVRGYGGLCLTRPATGAGALTMETCQGSSDQLWRVEQSDISGRVRLRSETGNLCLTTDEVSLHPALATPCSLTHIYLPMVMEAISRAPTAALPEISHQTSPHAGLTGIRDFVLGKGGSIFVPYLFSDNLCLDVRDVYDSSFTGGNGGPAPGDTVQFFECIDAQLNQKWSFSGHVVSGNKCLSLAGGAVDNGNPAVVATCSRAPEQDWDYDW